MVRLPMIVLTCARLCVCLINHALCHELYKINMHRCNLHLLTFASNYHMHVFLYLDLVIVNTHDNICNLCSCGSWSDIAWLLFLKENIVVTALAEITAVCPQVAFCTFTHGMIGWWVYTYHENHSLHCKTLVWMQCTLLSLISLMLPEMGHIDG